MFAMQKRKIRQMKTERHIFFIAIFKSEFQTGTPFKLFPEVHQNLKLSPLTLNRVLGVNCSRNAINNVKR